MNIKYHIGLLTCLVSFTGHANAQFSGGSVIMHSDPRLAVMLKKNPVAAPPPTRVRNPEALEDKGHSYNRNSRKDGAVTAAAPSTRGSKQVAVNETVTTTHVADNVHHPGPALHRDTKVIYTGKGFRVQIYNGYDRDKAIKVRAEFMRMFPGTYTYLSYVSPGFRVRVGDFRSRDQAAGMLREANSMYPTPCMIVPDQITVHAD